MKNDFLDANLNKQSLLDEACYCFRMFAYLAGASEDIQEGCIVAYCLARLFALRNFLLR